MSVREAFRQQAAHCTELGSPFIARLCTLAATRIARGSAVAERVMDWPGNPSNRADALPLRLAGGLHGLVVEARDADLVAVYPPNDAAVSDDGLWAAVETAFRVHSDYLLDRLDGPPQTNEPQRSNALCPGFLTVAALTGLPLVTTGLRSDWLRRGPVARRRSGQSMCASAPAATAPRRT